jgi:CHAT domain-containing protein/tetratricopeptide (TPR) repeat protein
MKRAIRRRFYSALALLIGLETTVTLPVQSIEIPSLVSQNTSAQTALLEEAERLGDQVFASLESGSFVVTEMVDLLERIVAIRRQLASENLESASRLAEYTNLYRNFLTIKYRSIERSCGETESIYQEMIALLTSREWTLDQEKAIFLSNIASAIGGFFYECGNLASSEHWFKQSLATQIQAELYIDPLGSSISNNFAPVDYLIRIYGRQNRFQEMISISEAVLQHNRAVLSPYDSRLIENLRQVASLYRSLGYPESSEVRFREVLGLERQAYALQNPQVDSWRLAGALNDLAVLLLDLGRYEEAQAFSEEAIALVRQIGELPSDQKSTFSIMLTTLAGSYASQGRNEEAELLYREALDVDRNLGTLNLSALFYFNQGQYSEAELLLEEAYNDTSGGGRLVDLADERTRINILNNLATVYLMQDQFDNAERLYWESIRILSERFPQRHPKFATVFSNLSEVSFAKGNIESGIALRESSSSIQEQTISRILAIGNEPQRQAYLAVHAQDFSSILSLNLHRFPNNSRIARLAFTTVLRRKGRILEAATDSLQILRQQLQNDPEAQQLLDQLRHVRTQLSNLLVGGQQAISPGDYTSSFEALVAEEQRLEAALSDRSAQFRTQNEPVTLEALQDSNLIPSDAALVEFVQYQWQNKSHYAAYILRTQGEPQFKYLGEADAIDQAVEEFRQALRDPRNLSAVQQTGQALNALVMQPIREMLGDAHHLLLSPDGSLNLIPFEALVNAQGQYLLQQYSISYLTSGRDLLRLQVQPPSRQAPSIIANPDYDRGEPLVAAASDQTRSNGNQRSADLSALLPFKSLDGFQREADTLRELFEERFSEVSSFTGEQATEDRVKQVQAPRILHIATHGFFLSDQDIEFIPQYTLNSYEVTERQILQIENPLLRSGLALADANPPRPDPRSDQEDGILTALEVTGLDLWGTQLVVLSACETGLGEATNGEGVYGMRRALVMAGAQSQIISLWGVDDDSTKDLMVEYYKRLLDDGTPLGRHEALRQAQLAMINGSDYRHPYYWAAFIPSGDWRPLFGN